LSAQPVAEQLSFEYTIYHLISGAAQLVMDDRRSYSINPPGFAFILPGKGYRIEPVAGEARALSIRIKRETISELATELGLESAGGEIFFLRDADPDIPELRSLCETLIFEASSGLAGQQIALDAILTQMVVLLLRKCMGVRRNQQLEISRVGVVDR